MDKPRYYGYTLELHQRSMVVQRLFFRRGQVANQRLGYFVFFLEVTPQQTLHADPNTVTDIDNTYLSI